MVTSRKHPDMWICETSASSADFDTDALCPSPSLQPHLRRRTRYIHHYPHSVCDFCYLIIAWHFAVPKGGIEKGESSLEAAIRESWEEGEGALSSSPHTS